MNELLSFLSVVGIMAGMFISLAYLVQKDWTEEERQVVWHSGHWKDKK